MRTAVLHGFFLICLHLGSATEYRENTYSVQEQSQEFSSPGAGVPTNHVTWAEGDYAYPVGNYLEAERYMIYPANNYPPHLSFHMPRYSGVLPVEYSHVNQESIPSIHTYKPSFTGKDFNEYPHILPSGGKSIEQLQQEADFRLKKLYFESRENNKMIGEKIKKLKDTYGYGTIGYPGYRNIIKYEPIDLGTHKAIDLGSTLAGPGLRLPVRTVTVTKTLQVRVPQPYPVRQEIPVPAPYPVPVAEPHFNDGSVHSGREMKHYIDAFASEFSGRPSFSQPDSVIGKGFGSSNVKRENKGMTTTSTTPANVITYSGFRSSTRPQTSPRTGYHI